MSSSFGQSVLDQAYLAIGFSLLIIFLYVSFRFEWRYSVPMMVALGHDILITLGIYSLSQREVTADTVAAVLTVLGYSLYDTVIVFDRVRENIPILRRMTASQVVNESLAETITRSLNTSVVTLIPVALLFIFGSGSLTDFAFALMVGIASGAYSSIFIASPLLAILLEREAQFAIAAASDARVAGREAGAGAGGGGSGGSADGADRPRRDVAAQRRADGVANRDAAPESPIGGMRHHPGGRCTDKHAPAVRQLAPLRRSHRRDRVDPCALIGCRHP